MTGKYKLVCFDVDGTLVKDRKGENFWGSLHSEIEGEKGVTIEKARAKAFAAGKLAYSRWAELDLRGFKREGATINQFRKAARATVMELHRRGIKLAVISGSIRTIIDELFPDHPFSEVFTNEVFFNEEGKLTRWKVASAGSRGKAAFLRKACRKYKVKLAESVFVGDGQNDVDALRTAGLGIAFCPRNEKVAKAANAVVDELDIRKILPLIERN
jgi:phosphoserine phosphatase